MVQGWEGLREQEKIFPRKFYSSPGGKIIKSKLDEIYEKNNWLKIIKKIGGKKIMENNEKITVEHALKKKT